MVCSTFLAYAHVQSGVGFVSPFTYSHPQIAAASNSLFAAAQDSCNSGFGFWGSIGIDIACPFRNVCENAGDQVTNCMAANACSTDDNSIWHGVRDNTFTTATSISPDRIAGRGPHGVGTTVWSFDQPSHPVAWNAPGAQYGCWY